MRVLKNLVLILSLKCDESSRLLSEALERRLTWSERWAVRLHVAGCWSCRQFRRQIAFLRLASRRRAAPDAPHSHVLSPEARARVEAALRRGAEE